MLGDDAMGLIIGLIGANIIAKNVGSKIVESVQAYSEGAVRSERARSDANIEIARIQSEMLQNVERMRMASDITTTGMKTGFFTSAMGNRNESYIDNCSDHESPRRLPQYAKVMYCSECGGKQEEDAVFCKYCGHRL